MRKTLAGGRGGAEGKTNQNGRCRERERNRETKKKKRRARKNPPKKQKWRGENKKHTEVVWGWR